MSAGDKGKLTGRKVLLIFVACFGIVIAANLVLLFRAIGTFSGVVVSNSYIASQSFNEARAAQAALGWQTALRLDAATLYIDMTGPAGDTVRPADIAATIGRPADQSTDRPLALEPTPRGYGAPVDLAPGNWRVELRATAADGTPFLEYHTLYVPKPE